MIISKNKVPNIFKSSFQNFARYNSIVWKLRGSITVKSGKRVKCYVKNFKSIKENSWKNVFSFFKLYLNKID